MFGNLRSGLKGRNLGGSAEPRGIGAGFPAIFLELVQLFFQVGFSFLELLYF